MSDLTVLALTLTFLAACIAPMVYPCWQQSREAGLRERREQQRAFVYEYGEATAKLRQAESQRETLIFEINRCRPTLTRQFPPPPDRLKAELATVKEDIAVQQQLQVLYRDAIIKRTA